MTGWRAALVALVVGSAILAAGVLIPRLGSSVAEGGPETPPAGGSGLVLACPRALETACRAVAAEEGLDFETWEPAASLPERGVVLAPAADLPEGSQPGPVVATSPIVVGAWRERAQVLVAACGEVDLDCVASALGSSWEDLGGNDAWGDVKIGLADPGRTEAGMLAWSVAAPLADDAALRVALRMVSPDDGRLAVDLVTFGPARADLVVTTEVAVASQMENAIGRGGRLEVYHPESAPWVEYAATPNGRGAGGLVDLLAGDDGRRLLASGGLRGPDGGGEGLPPDLGAPGARAPVPDAATRATLTERWSGL